MKKAGNPRLCVEKHLDKVTLSSEIVTDWYPGQISSRPVQSTRHERLEQRFTGEKWRRFTNKMCDKAHNGSISLKTADRAHCTPLLNWSLIPNKGKLVARRGRKATGQTINLTAGLPKEESHA
jgi:hypothetical protein